MNLQEKKKEKFRSFSRHIRGVSVVEVAVSSSFKIEMPVSSSLKIEKPVSLSLKTENSVSSSLKIKNQHGDVTIFPKEKAKTFSSSGTAASSGTKLSEQNKGNAAPITPKGKANGLSTEISRGIEKVQGKNKNSYRRATLASLGKGKVDDLHIYKVLKELFDDLKKPSEIHVFIDSLLETMITESINAEAVAKYIFILSHDKDKGANLRSSLFGILQNYFLSKHLNLKKQGAEKFKNFLRFFTAVVHHNRHPELAPFDALISALLDFAEMLSNFLDSEEDVKLFCIIALRFQHYHELNPTLYSETTLKKYEKLQKMVKEKTLNYPPGGSQGSLEYPENSKELEKTEQTPIDPDVYKIVIPKSDVEIYKNMESMGQYITLC